MKMFHKMNSAYLVIELSMNGEGMQTGELGFVTANIVNEVKHSH